MRSIFTRPHAAEPSALNDDLRTGLGLRFQKDGVHVNRGRHTAGQRLQGLRTADFPAIGSHCRVIGHVLGLERSHRQPAVGEMTAQPGNKHRFADIRAGTLDHDAGRHQNSTPIWAFMPERNGCFTRLISVTRSAISISSSAAFRPVRTTWVISGFSVRRKSSTSSSDMYP